MLLPRSTCPQPVHHEAKIRPERRRRSKNSGGGISPAAIGALIEGGLASVNAFRIPLRLLEAPTWRLQTPETVEYPFSPHYWQVRRDEDGEE
jgi:hypothetical protein